jgi:SAM-dependent methyltransferase
MVTVFNPPGPVLEVGSRQVQGPAGDLRPLFLGREYLGCDAQTGPGVDRVEDIEHLSFPDGWAGTVLCLNVLEHVWNPIRGMEEVRRVTAVGGVALVVAPFEFHVHSYPEDYWRFTPRAIERLFEGFETVLVGWQGHESSPRLVFALGQKSRREDADALAERWRAETLARWTERPPAWDRLRAAVGGALFGRRAFRQIRHWRDLAIIATRAGRNGKEPR